MDAEAKRAKESIKDMPLKEKIKHYWYYYKTHFFLLLLAVLVIWWSLAQCINKIDYDLYIPMFTSGYVSDEQIVVLEDFLKNKVTDINENGTIDVGVYSNVGQFDADKMEYQSQETQAILMKIQVTLATGESPAYIMDEPYMKYMTRTYKEGTDYVVDLTTIPELQEGLGLTDEKTLYWVSVVQPHNVAEQNKGKITQFNNGDIIEKYFKTKG